MRRPADPCRGGGSSLVPAAPSEGTPDVRVGRRRNGAIGRAEMWLPGRLARGLSPLADSSAHIVGDAFPPRPRRPFPTAPSPRQPPEWSVFHSCHQCHTHVLAVKAGRLLPARAPSVAALGGFSRTLRQKRDRKSTRLNSSHVAISYAVFCLKK